MISKNHTILCFLFLVNVILSQNKNDIIEIRKSMKAQQEAWNKADIDGFMNYYWKDDSLKFIGSKGITYWLAKYVR